MLGACLIRMTASLGGIGIADAPSTTAHQTSHLPEMYLDCKSNSNPPSIFFTGMIASLQGARETAAAPQITSHLPARRKSTRAPVPSKRFSFYS